MTKLLREPLHEALRPSGKSLLQAYVWHLSTLVPFSSMEERLQNVWWTWHLKYHIQCCHVKSGKSGTPNVLVKQISK